MVLWRDAISSGSWGDETYWMSWPRWWCPWVIKCKQKWPWIWGPGHLSACCWHSESLGKTAKWDGVGILTNLHLEQSMDCQAPWPCCQVGEVTGNARHKGSFANTLCWSDWIHSFFRLVLGSKNYATGRSAFKTTWHKEDYCLHFMCLAQVAFTQRIWGLCYLRWTRRCIPVTKPNKTVLTQQRRQTKIR